MLRLSGICLALLALSACSDNRQELARLERELAAQRTALEDGDRRREAEYRNLRTEIASLSDLLRDRSAAAERPQQLDQQLARMEERFELARTEAVEAARAESAAQAAAARETFAELAARKLAEQQAAQAPTKDLRVALDRLSASEYEKEQVRREIVDAKRQILETLETRTEDGRNFAVELVDKILLIQDGQAGQTELHKLFAELATTKIPGDPHGRTYVEAINEIKQKNRENIGRILTAEDQQRLTRAHEDWTDFELVDADPWAALYLERLELFNG